MKLKIIAHPSEDVEEKLEAELRYHRSCHLWFMCFAASIKTIMDVMEKNVSLTANNMVYCVVKF